MWVLKEICGKGLVICSILEEFLMLSCAGKSCFYAGAGLEVETVVRGFVPIGE